MDELNSWGHQHATDRQRKLLAQDIVEQVFDAVRPQLVGAVQAFLAMPISASALHQFELALVLLVREIGRLVLQASKGELRWGQTLFSVFVTDFQAPDARVLRTLR